MLTKPFPTTGFQIINERSQLTITALRAKTINLLPTEISGSAPECKHFLPCAARRIFILRQRRSTNAHQLLNSERFPGEKWGRRDSNPQPSDYESPALTVELQPLFQFAPYELQSSDLHELFTDSFCGRDLKVYTSEKTGEREVESKTSGACGSSRKDAPPSF